MILDTDASYETIFPLQGLSPVRYLSCGSNRMLGVRNVEGRMIVDSLVSTNPYDYLNPTWTPGKPFHG